MSSAADRYTRATERAAALQFLAATYDGVDDAEARRIRASIKSVVTDEVMWSGAYARGPYGTRVDEDKSDALYTDDDAWNAHMASYHVKANRPAR